jgi:hypothetical protein|tara:strand:+ start:14810 stop:15136 length:327 start_codon:yes stop_codon:yes gene_type:complete
MHIAVTVGIVRTRNNLMMMTDEEMKGLIEVLTDLFEDQIIEGVHPISVASVMLAVAVKQLKRRLDPDEFSAIMDDITSNEWDEWEKLSDEEIDTLLSDLEDKNKRTVH